jgi:hypothetical protein
MDLRNKAIVTVGPHASGDGAEEFMACLVSRASLSTPAPPKAAG